MVIVNTLPEKEIPNKRRSNMSIEISKVVAFPERREEWSHDIYYKPCKIDFAEGFNKLHDNLSKRKVGLDVEKVMDAIDKDYEEGNFVLPYSIRKEIIDALNANLGLVLKEVKE